MLILKGDLGKSRVIDILMDNTNSICFVYYGHPFSFDAFYLDSREYSLEDFLECIFNGMKHAVTNDKYYDYLLIYTNQNEEDLQDIINWLDNYKYEIPCRDVIVTCK